jgi:hypothetical protein
VLLPVVLLFLGLDFFALLLLKARLLKDSIDFLLGPKKLLFSQVKVTFAPLTFAGFEAFFCQLMKSEVGPDQFSQYLPRVSLIG